MKGLGDLWNGVRGRGRPDERAAPPSPVARLDAVDAFERGAFACRLPVDLAFPERDGIAHDSAAALMESNRGLVVQARDAFQAKEELPQADRLILDLIYRFACQVGTLPASRTYHHTARGGLFQHSLAVAVGALHMAQGKNMVYASSPRDRDAHMMGWQLAVFCAALLHDIGKIHTIGRVQAMGIETDVEDGSFRSVSAPAYDTIWYPTVESFERWADTNRVTSYFIDYDHAETRPHTGYTERHLARIVPPAILAFIHKGNPHVLSMFEAFLRNPDTGANTPLSMLVHDADHVNVAQALDPRRKPGAMEVTGLVWRRLTEFAAEAVWNLPTSPFIRAHVHIEGTDPKRFVQMPFFVATQDNIAAFLDFIVSNPLFGVSLGRRGEQVVFGALETASHLNRTVGDILPEQIQVEGMPEHIPASRAHVLFMPRRTEATLTGGPISSEPVLIELPVIPLGGTIATHHTQHMPTLGFRTPPSYPVTDSIPIVMIRGEIKPEDPNRENDHSYVEDLDALVGKRKRYTEITRRHKLSPEDAGSVSSIAQGQQAQFTCDAVDVPRRDETGAQSSTCERPGEIGKRDRSSVQNDGPEDAPQGAANRSSTPNEPARPSTDRTSTAKPDGQGDAPAPSHVIGRGIASDAPADAPLWQTLYMAREETPAAALWASAWVFFLDGKGPERSYRPADGIYAFATQSMSQKMRKGFLAAIRSAGCDPAYVLHNWSAKGLAKNSPGFATWFSPRKDNHMVVAGEIADLLDRVMPLETADSAEAAS